VSLRDGTPYSGMLIAICGLDGSGKTTQANLLAEQLRVNGPVSVLRPNTDEFRYDQPITDYMEGHLPPDQMYDMVIEMPLMAAANLFRQMRTTIMPRLRAGEIVICDRYVYTVYARARARGLRDQEWLSQLNRYLPEPDLTLYMDVRPEVALQRVLARDKVPKWEELDLDRIAAVRSALLEQPWGPRDSYQIIDAERPVVEIAADVRRAVAAMGIIASDPEVAVVEVGRTESVTQSRR